MPLTEKELEDHIRSKPVMTAGDLSRFEHVEGEGPVMRVGDKRLPLMPLAADRQPPGPPPGGGLLEAARALAARAGLFLIADAAPVASGPTASAPTAGATSATPGLVDHRKFQTPVKDQKHRATCVAFATLAALEAISKRRSVNGQPDLDLSEQYAHWLFMQSERRSQCDNDGLHALHAAAYLHAAGVCESSLWRYEDDDVVHNHCQLGPDDGASGQARFGIGRYSAILRRGLGGWSIRNTDFLEMLLGKGYDVVMALEGMVGIPDDAGIYDVKRDEQGNPWPAQAGHAMLAVGFEHEKYFLFKNSFGPDIDEAGYTKLSFDYVRVYAVEGFVVQELRGDISTKNG